MVMDRRARAIGAVHGLAFGDALGAPASEHRTVRDPWVRGMLRKGALELDESRVLRQVVPFVLASLGAVPMMPTDDAESFAVAARALLDAPTLSADDLFDVWRALVDTDETWVGPAQRSALLNAAAGLRPPQTGADNPAFYDDTALAGSLAAAILAPQPVDAAALARELASISHDGVGIEAAATFAGIVAEGFSGMSFDDAIAAAIAVGIEDSWLADGIADALTIVDGAASGFMALPRLIARFAPRTYSHPGTVTETLPLALAIAQVSGCDHETAIPLALSVARHQDSLPALVGALCGAFGSAPDPTDIDTLHGVTVPGTTGWSLTELTDELLTAR